MANVINNIKEATTTTASSTATALASEATGIGRSRFHRQNNNNTTNVNNNNNHKSNIVAGETMDKPMHSLQDIRNYLESSSSSTMDDTKSPYEHIMSLMCGLNLDDDSIVLNHKIKSIETDFCNLIHDKTMLNESMSLLNQKALSDHDAAQKFALLFSSRTFDALAMQETKIRSAMLQLLETNFLEAQNYRLQSRDRLYNSITLLGEYYNRVRLADHAPIDILGTSLLSLLTQEIVEYDCMDVKLANLILTQITLNGQLLRKKHAKEVEVLFYELRRLLIERQNLSAKTKALMLMTLDLFYCKFAYMGHQLEEMYSNYLSQEDNDEDDDQGRSGGNANSSFEGQQQQNGTSQDSYEASVQTSPTLGQKKWSEQVCEDSLYESETFSTVDTQSQMHCDNGLAQRQEDVEGRNMPNHNYGDRDEEHEHKAINHHRQRGDGRRDRKPNRRIFSPQRRYSGAPANAESNAHSPEGPEEDARPRWRAPRFKRNERSNMTHSSSGNFDDDTQDTRSEGGNVVRLYSIGDRLRHSQEKFERIMGNQQQNNIANSNWDRQSQRDDRSERSYISNYERGAHNRRGGGHGSHNDGNRHRYSNRQTYDKPPRFQKHQQRGGGADNGGRIHSESWRRSRNNSQSSSYAADDSQWQDIPMDTRSLPRPHKKPHLNENNGGGRYNPRRSQSPGHYRGSGGRGGGRHPKSHYGSHNSLASENSSTFSRNSYQRARGYNNRRPSQERYQQQEGGGRQPQEKLECKDWNTDEPRNEKDNAPGPSAAVDAELVRNARQTTKYMNYLSSKK